MNRGFTLFVLFRLLTGSPVFAVNYYLSNAGNDANNGTSPFTPWKTITQLNTATLLPGDSILFMSGNHFSGQMVVSANGNETGIIYFGIYGGTDPALISGAVTLNNWANSGPEIYKASLATTPAHFFVDQKQMVIARFPNNGYRFHQQGAGNTGFVDSSLIQAGSDWQGAGIRMRTTDRLFEWNQVDQFVNDTIYFLNNSAVPVESGYGYYLDNLYSELDTAGEWFYDAGSSTIFYFPAPGSDPNGQITEASIHSNGILFQNGGSYCQVENIRFEKQSLSGITATAPVTQLMIRNCSFILQGFTGLSLPYGASHVDISDCSFQYINGAAIVANELSESGILQNDISYIGLRPGYGINTLQQGMGISLDGGSAVVIAENIIDSTGNSAINANGDEIVIEKNVCRSNVLHFNRMGGIYSYGSNSGTVNIRQNMVFSTSGSAEASPYQSITTGGIFLDEQCDQYLVALNTVAFAINDGISIYRGGNNHTVSSNVVYGCHAAQLAFTEGGSAGFNQGHWVTGNRFYAIHEDADVVSLQSGFDNFAPAVFDSNYYFNPYNFFAFKKRTISLQGNTDQYFTLSQWKAAFGGDADSRETFFFRNRYHVTSFTGEELVGNGQFTNNTDGWVNQTPGNLEVLLDNATLLDYGCMKLVTLTGGPSDYGEASYSGIPADSGSFYQLSFSCFSTREGNSAFFHKQQEAPYLTLNLLRYFPFTLTRRDYAVVFQNHYNPAATRLVAHLPVSDSLCWLDNISLREVETQYEDPTRKSKLFVNSTPQTVNYQLLDSVFFNLNQEAVTNQLTLPPFSSAILVFDSSMITMTQNSKTQFKEKPSLLIFPSITTSQQGMTIRHNLATPAQFTLRITDNQGRLVYQQYVDQPFMTKHITLPAGMMRGMYLLMLDNTQHHLQGKFILY